MNYKIKAKDSFKTKLNLFVYNQVINSKKTISNEEFEKFEITSPIVNHYLHEYWNKSYDITNKSIKDKIDEIYQNIESFKNDNFEIIKVCEENYISTFLDKKFPENSFEKITSKKECCYCQLTELKISELAISGLLNKKNLRGWKLELERFDSNYEYSKENCDMACYWCNNAKTDEFTMEEFKEVGKVFSAIWKKRLSK